MQLFISCDWQLLLQFLQHYYQLDDLPLSLRIAISFAISSDQKLVESWIKYWLDYKEGQVSFLLSYDCVYGVVELSSGGGTSVGERKREKAKPIQNLYKSFSLPFKSHICDWHFFMIYESNPVPMTPDLGYFPKHRQRRRRRRRRQQQQTNCTTYIHRLLFLELTFSPSSNPIQGCFNGHETYLGKGHE